MEKGGGSMKIRLAKKIMSSGNNYWKDKRIDNAMLNENWVDDANYIRDHRITKAISLTRKKKNI